MASTRRFELKAHQLTCEVPPFRCGDDGLDSFLAENAWDYQELGIATTYLATLRTPTGESGILIGYVTLCADAVVLGTGERRQLRPKLGFSHPQVVPALKVARLAVSRERQKTGAGTFLMRLAHALGLGMQSSVGCRLLTVDAYESSLGFYTRLGFQPNKAVERREGSTTASMRLDLNPPRDWLE
ncbi:MAG: hypothetical protein RJA70_3973 [Pseudomonadota bacterium]